MDAREHYSAGNLDDALTAAAEQLKRQPTDTSLRGFFCELLCFAGELERADKQLETIGQQDPGAAIGVSMFRQLIRAETARQQFFSEGRVPEFIHEPGPVLARHLEASILVREGDAARAAELLQEAATEAVDISGTCDTEAFTEFRDLDDLTAPFFEVLTSTGKYYWIPIERVESIEFAPVKRPRDLVWRRVQMDVRNGPDGEVFLPALYYGTATSEDRALRLGRATDWTGGEGAPVRGLGLRTFLVGDSDLTINQLNSLTFNQSDNA